MQIAINDIKLSPYQVRDLESDPDLAALAESIKEHGQLQPIKVRPSDGGYECIFGHRRLKAAELAGWTEVEAMVGEVSDGKAALENLVENLQRRDLSIPQKGQSILDIQKALQDEREDSSVGLTEIAAMLGIEDSSLRRWCRAATKLSAHVKELAAAHKLNDHALGGLASYEMHAQDPIADVLAIARDKPEVSFGYGTVQRFFKVLRQEPGLDPQEALNIVLSMQPDKPVLDVLQRGVDVSSSCDTTQTIDTTLSDRLEERRQEAIAAGAPPEITYEDLIKPAEQVADDVIYQEIKAKVSAAGSEKGPMTVTDYVFRLETAAGRIETFLTAGREVEVWYEESWPIIRGLLGGMVTKIEEFIREAEHARG